ncbi:hypothetical protein DFH09DRAFT_1326319 [Mycena vulgaris]|nr:hypothetical protein DFH09DRAFT_1329277 [Mycena vulgaris]KAJ6532196.1 hypothetical protein DFH09DRAFT_1326319 [Mycena vulgaris]
MAENVLTSLCLEPDLQVTYLHVEALEHTPTRDSIGSAPVVSRTIDLNKGERYFVTDLYFDVAFVFATECSTSAPTVNDSLDDLPELIPLEDEDVIPRCCPPRRTCSSALPKAKL